MRRSQYDGIMEKIGDVRMNFLYALGRVEEMESRSAPPAVGSATTPLGRGLENLRELEAEIESSVRIDA